MSKQREKQLLKELDRLAFVASTVAIVVLFILYFLIAGTAPTDSFLITLRTFTLDLITNLIPTFLLFAGSYAFFRRIQTIRSERDTEELSEELAAKVSEQVIKGLAIRPITEDLETQKPKQISKEDEFSMMVSGEFDITNKYFDSKSTPQKIIIEHTNRGSEVIRVQKVKFSPNITGFSDSALLSSYRKEGARYVIIPFDQNKAEIFPGQKFVVEFGLEQRWEPQKINGLIGQLGFLKPDVLYNGQPVELFYHI